MAQFSCPICGKGFDQKSMYGRHMQTSHPEQAVSAADVESAIKGINFPKNKKQLVTFAEKINPDSKAIGMIRQLPEKKYRDAAEVAIAIGQVKANETKPEHQPSSLGGAKAKDSASASKLAESFSGINLPKKGRELREYAATIRDKRLRSIVSKFSEDKIFKDMSDIEKEFGRLS